MGRTKPLPHEIAWAKLFYELDEDTRTFIRAVALLKRAQKRPRLWTDGSLQPVVIGDRREAGRSKPNIGRRETDMR